MSDELQVTGGSLPNGVGPVSVDTLNITATANVVRGTAWRATGIGKDLALLALDPSLHQAAVFDPAGAVRVQRAIASAGLGGNGISANVGRLTEHASNLSTAALAYETTEGRVGYLLNNGVARIDNLATRLMGVRNPAVQEAAAKWLLARRVIDETGDVFRDMARGKPVNKALADNGEDLLRKSGEVLISAAPALFGPPFTVQHSAQVLTSGLHGLKLDASDRRVVVEARPARRVAGESGFRGTTQGLRELQAGDSQGTVSLTTITRPDHSKAYVLNLPGTQDKWGGENPMDWLSNFQEKAGVRSDAQQVALAALAKVPAGSKVMITGYSQGGIVATNLAADPAVRRRFQIRNAMTFGSPVGDVTGRLPKGTTTMNVQHGDDPVPMFDGRGAVPGRSHYVATVDSPDRLTPGVDGPHKFNAYRDTLDRLARSNDPSAIEYRASTNEFQIGKGDTVTVQEFKGRRVPR